MRRLIIAVIRIMKDILIFAILTYKLLLLLFELPPIFTWLLSNLQILIINYVFQQLIYSRLFSGKSDSDLCTLFSDRTLINRRNVTGDPHSSYWANWDFLLTIFQSRVITAAMTVLDLLINQVPQHTTPYQKTWRKWEKPRNLSSSMASLKRWFILSFSSRVKNCKN